MLVSADDSSYKVLGKEMNLSRDVLRENTVKEQVEYVNGGIEMKEKQLHDYVLFIEALATSMRGRDACSYSRPRSPQVRSDFKLAAGLEQG